METRPTAWAHVAGAQEVGAGLEVPVQVGLGYPVVVADLAHVVLDSWGDKGFSWAQF